MTILVHGFWGQPADWNEVLKRLPLAESVLTPDLYENGPLAPGHTLKHWTENFLNFLDKGAGEEPVQLVGYSMGARLGLNALIAKPERFRRALLLSGNPYLAPSEHPARQRFDKMWAHKFLEQPWAELEETWEDQSVFSGSERVPRRRKDELREKIGLSMVNWSPIHHPFTLEEVKALPSTVDFAYGALDQKYMAVAKTLQELPVRGQITIIQNAGHRLPTDASSFIASWIQGESAHG